jgi:predicted phage tail protein
MGTLYQSDFATPVSGSWGADWTRLVGNSALNVTGGVATAANGGTSNVLVAGTTANDFDVTSTVVVGVAGNIVGPIARLVDANNFYYLDLGAYTNNVTFGRRIGGTYTDVSIVAFTYTVGTAYNLRLKVNGTSVQGKAWLATDAEPAGWQITTTDTNITGSGRAGIFVYAPGATAATVDNFLATDGAAAAATLRSSSVVAFKNREAIRATIQSQFGIRVNLKNPGAAMSIIRANLRQSSNNSFSTRATQLAQVQDTFSNRVTLRNTARANYFTRISQAAQAVAAFLIAIPNIMSLRSQATARFPVRSRLSGSAGISFVGRSRRALQAASAFLVNQIVNPINLVRELLASFEVVPALSASVSSAQLLTITVEAQHMITPNSTVESKILVVDDTGTLVTSLASAQVDIQFPDGTAESHTLEDLTNLGGGRWQLAYTTKGPGPHVETWHIVDVDGNSATVRNQLPVSF